MGNFSFDEKEFDQGENADAALEDLEESPAEEEVFEENPELADVDLRLETADYYRAILKQDFFDAESQAAQIVDAEIRAFIRERLEILLGLRSPRAQDVQQFEEAEVQALKIVAAKVLGKPALAEQVKSAPPIVKKMATPSQAPRPLPRPKPQAKKISPPLPAPSTKPRVKPQPPAPPKASQKNQHRAPTEELKKAAEMVGALAPGQVGESQTYVKADGTQVTLIEGEVFEDAGRRYRVVMNDRGTLYRRDITGQQVPTNRIPQPSAQQMSMLSQQHAMEVVSKLDQITGAAVIHSLKQGE